MDFQIYDVKLRARAKNDLANQFDFLIKITQDIGIANRIITELEQKLEGLEFMPNRHPRMPEPNADKRRLIHKNFIAVFIVNEEKKTVSILRVFDARMNYIKYV